MTVLGHRGAKNSSDRPLAIQERMEAGKKAYVYSIVQFHGNHVICSSMERSLLKIAYTVLHTIRYLNQMSDIYSMQEDSTLRVRLDHNMVRCI